MTNQDISTTKYLAQFGKPLITAALVVFYPMFLPADLNAGTPSMVAPATAARKFTIASPGVNSPRAGLRTASTFLAQALKKAAQISTADAAAVQALVPSVLSSTSATIINKRNAAVRRLTSAAMKQYHSDVKKLLKGQAISVRKGSVPAKPFGDPPRSIPAAGKMDELNAAQIQVARMRSFDYALLAAIQAAGTPGAVGRKAVSAVAKAIRKDLKLLSALASQIDNRLYSTSALESWSRAELSNLSGRTFAGSVRQIENGTTQDIRVKLTTSPDSDTVSVNMRAPGLSSLLRLSLAGGAIPEECNASGQIGLGGLYFSGPMDHPECGKLDLQVDAKGGLTGTLTDFPSGGSLSQLQIQQVILKGVIPRGGPANVAARAIWSQDGSTGESLNQINVEGEATETFTAVSAGDYLSALLTSSGRVFNAALLYSPSGITPVVKEVPGISNAVAVSCGTECFAVDGSGVVYTWTWTFGHDEFTPSAAQVYTGISGIKAIAAGKSGFMLAIKNDGTVWTWGANGQNQLGDGTTEDRPNPAQLLSLGADNAAVAAGDYQGVVRKNDGSVYFWGRISNALEPFPTPTLLEGVAPATRISAGGSYNLAQLDDGSVYAWGHLQAGLVPGISNPLGITAGAELYFSPLFLKSDGTVWRVGFSMIDGSMQTPEQVNGLSDIKLLDAYSNAFYIRGDGAVVMQASTDTEPYVVTGIL